MRDKERDHLPNTRPLLPHQPNHVWNHHFDVVKRYLAGFKMNSGIGTDFTYNNEKNNLV
jgi:hypothetical protein